MARYILDTNIIAFMSSGNTDELDNNVQNILSDYNNQLYVSSVSVVELLQLFRIKKIKPKQYKTSESLSNAIEKDLLIQILPFNKQNTAQLAKLQIAATHNDPFDHAIIAHAISQKLTLVSSDRQFRNYTNQNLQFVFNKR